MLDEVGGGINEEDSRGKGTTEEKGGGTGGAAKGHGQYEGNKEKLTQLGATSALGLYIPGNTVIALHEEPPRPTTGHSVGGTG